MNSVKAVDIAERLICDCKCVAGLGSVTAVTVVERPVLQAGTAIAWHHESGLTLLLCRESFVQSIYGYHLFLDINVTPRNSFPLDTAPSLAPDESTTVSCDWPTNTSSPDMASALNCVISPRRAGKQISTDASWFTAKVGTIYTGDPIC